MNWDILKTKDQVNHLVEESKGKVILIFKHSIRCSISASALNRVERNWNEEDMDYDVKPYYLDLINFKDVSLQVAEVFNVTHESPQVLVIKDGVSVYNSSHFAIDYKSIKEAINDKATWPK